MPVVLKPGLLSILIVTLIVTVTSCITLRTPAPEQAPPSGRSPSGIAGQLRIEEPVTDDRFVEGEPVRCKVRLPSGTSTDGTQWQWRSNIDGYLGSGTQIEVKKLTAGTHEITVGDSKDKTSVQIRVFGDLWKLYQSNPSREESNRITADFAINWLDGNIPDEKWATYTAFKFEQQSPDPSKVVSLAKLDILRRQRFAQPLPFTSAKTAYEHLKSYVTKINLSLNCAINTAGGGTVNLNRSFSVWDGRQSGSTANPNACKLPLKQPPALDAYTNSLYLLLHEARHCEPSDTGHVVCQGSDNMDPALEVGSGHARAALYLMWVYKYSLYDPQHIREQARLAAQSILKSRFCSPLKHSNPLVQVVLNELVGQ